MSTHISDKGWSLVHPSHELKAIETAYTSGEGIEVLLWRNV